MGPPPIGRGEHGRASAFTARRRLRGYIPHLAPSHDLPIRSLDGRGWSTPWSPCGKAIGVTLVTQRASPVPPPPR